MHISGLALCAWITIYLGFSLVRSTIPLGRIDETPADPRKKIAYIGYGLLALGAVIFVLALRFH